MQKSSQRDITSDAAVHERGGKYYLCPLNKTTAGVYLYGAPVLVLPSDTGSEELGDTVIEALGSSRIGIPHPANPDSMPRLPLCEAAGVKSWSSFARGALYCKIRSASSLLDVVPSRREGGSFLHLPDQAVRIALPASSGEIGEAVRLALSRCE